MLRAIIALVIAISPAAASCPLLRDDWSVLRGDLAPGASCGAFVLTTDAGDSRFYNGGLFWHYSVARAARREPVHIPYELSFEFERLTPGNWQLELHPLGATITISNRTIAFVFNAAQLATEFFEEHPELGAPGRHRVVLRQTDRELSVIFDGKLLEHRAFAATGAGTIAIGLLGAPGQRTRARLSDLRFR